MAPRRRVRIPHPLLFAVLGIAVGLVFGYLAVDSYVGRRALDERGRETTARVVDVRDRVWPKSPRVRIEFATPDGPTVRTWVNGDRDDKPGVGEELAVRYDPRDPDGNVVPATDAGRGHLLFAGLAAAFLIGGPATAWFLVRPARRALAGNPGLAERVAGIQERNEAERR